MSRLFLILTLGLSAGCAAPSAPHSPAAPTTQLFQRSPETAAIVGTIIYRDPLPPSQDAVARVRLVDLSADQRSMPIAEMSIAPLASSPVPFVLPYDRATLRSGDAYAVSVRVETAGGQLLLVNTAVYPVLGAGAADRADVVVERVR